MALQTVVHERSLNRAMETANHFGFKNILFATDFSPAAEKALPFAIEIARRYSAKLYAVHVAGPAVYPYAPASDWPKLAEEDEIFRVEAKKELEQKLQPLAHELIFRTGKIWDTIAGLVREKQIDLLILGTRGKTGIEKALMGSIAEEIFRQALCPVLTVGPHVTVQTRSVAQLGRILYATDFSAESLAAAPYAISLAREHRAQLILLNCMEAPGDIPIMRQTLRELVPFGADLRCDPTCVVERGSHGEKILSAAEGHGADMIVLGVADRGNNPGKKSYFERSALYKIVTQANCPVLTVRS